MFLLLFSALQPALDVPNTSSVAEAAAVDAAPALPVSGESEIVTIPKLYPVVISIDKEVGSKVSTSKDFFPISLAQPVIINGTEIIPAGTKGVGQVVHAKKGGFGGSAGELVLAARYLEFAGKKIPLRSFEFIEADDERLARGKDNTESAMIASMIIAPLGFLIGGGNTIVQPGRLADAKLREDTELPAITPAAPKVAVPEAEAATTNTEVDNEDEE